MHLNICLAVRVCVLSPAGRIVQRFFPCRGLCYPLWAAPVSLTLLFSKPQSRFGWGSTADVSGTKVALVSRFSCHDCQGMQPNLVICLMLRQQKENHSRAKCQHSSPEDRFGNFWKETFGIFGNLEAFYSHFLAGVCPAYARASGEEFGV